MADVHNLFWGLNRSDIFINVKTSIILTINQNSAENSIILFDGTRPLTTKNWPLTNRGIFDTGVQWWRTVAKEFFRRP